MRVLSSIATASLLIASVSALPNVQPRQETDVQTTDTESPASTTTGTESTASTTGTDTATTDTTASTTGTDTTASTTGTESTTSTSGTETPASTTDDPSATSTTAVETTPTDPALAPWVTVDPDGKPSTITPQLTTVDGSTSIIDGAPHDITASLYTSTSLGKITTSTGEAPLPTATNTKNPAGSFPSCYNLDGDHAPWCSPSEGDTLYPGKSYYFLWDPRYYADSNTTNITVVGNYVNETTGETIEQAFQSDEIKASYGFWNYKIEKKLLKYQQGQNITLNLVSSTNTTTVKQEGPKVQIKKVPGYKPKAPQPHGGAAVYIAVPIIVAFIVLMVGGTCYYNKQHRHIDLADLLSRTRRRGYGAGKSARARRGLGGRKGRGEDIQLMEREILPNGFEVYHDNPRPRRARRDSEALDSLAGSPVEERRMDFQQPGDRNHFRDELRRQEEERR
ncbi:hypothetical protein F4780DRAFT_386442 [Xylariomycetidae sp. FL0641]|nr:hypothetical protein F4780DRAFT_386442 [Xylariomycetidae sp. FL0641]